MKRGLLEKKIPKKVEFLLVFAFIVFGAWFVMATLTDVTLEAPVTDSNISGTYVFNATTTGTSADNVTFYWWNDTGSEWIEIGVNATADGEGPFTFSYDTTNIPDGTDHVFNATAKNDTTTVSTNNTGIAVDNTAPNVSAINAPAANANLSGESVVLNATVTDETLTVDTVQFNVSNSSGGQPLLTATNPSGNFFNATLNTTSLVDGSYNITVVANDTVGNVNNTEYITITIDNQDPSLSLSKASSTRKSITVSKSCSFGPSGEESCGISSSSGSVSGSEVTGLSCGNSYDITLTGKSNSGMEASTQVSMSTNNCASGGGVAIPTLPKQSHSWAQITPGAASIMKDFDSEIGVKQITINVNNPAQNVKITVTKHDGKPSEVSVAKTGTVYQYLEVNAENLEGNLDNAVVQFRVEKSWASDNNLGMNEVSAFKYDESANVWNELETNFVEEDGTYYYYNVELDSFSFFAIGESTATASGEDGTDQTPEEEEERGSRAWLWILVGLIVIVVAAYLGIMSRKK